MRNNFWRPIRRVVTRVSWRVLLIKIFAGEKPGAKVLPRLNSFDWLMIHGGQVQPGGGEKGKGRLELIPISLQFFRLAATITNTVGRQTSFLANLFLSSVLSEAGDWLKIRLSGIWNSEIIDYRKSYYPTFKKYKKRDQMILVHSANCVYMTLGSLVKNWHSRPLESEF